MAPVTNVNTNRLEAAQTGVKLIKPLSWLIVLQSWLGVGSPRSPSRPSAGSP